MSEVPFLIPVPVAFTTLLPFKISAILDKKLVSDWQNDLNLNTLRKDLKDYKSINIISIGNVNKDFLKKISTLLNKDVSNKAKIHEKIQLWEESDYCLLIIEKGRIKKNTIEKLKENIEISKIFINSWILIN